MMDFLHDHHRGEDEGLWPLVTGRNPQAAGLLAAMEAEHALIVPAADRLSATARRYDLEAGAVQQRELAAVLDELAAVVLPHLARKRQMCCPWSQRASPTLSGGTGNRSATSRASHPGISPAERTG